MKQFTLSSNKMNRNREIIKSAARTSGRRWRRRNNETQTWSDTYFAFALLLYSPNKWNKRIHIHSILPYRATHIDAHNRNTCTHTHTHIAFINLKRKRKTHRQCVKEANWCKCESIVMFQCKEKKIWAIKQSGAVGLKDGIEVRKSK